jgi:hypothetical protein
MGKRRHKKRLQKAEELARFMATHEIAPDNHRLAKNALSVAALVGEVEADVDMEGRLIMPSKALVAIVDRYVTLRAMALHKAGNQASWELVQRLAQEEPEGTDFMILTLLNLRKLEAARVSAGSLKVAMNAWKGYIPAEVRQGAQLMVAHDSEAKRLLSMGFTRLGDYAGSGYEIGKYGYYYSTVGGNSVYQQGAMQTVHTTAMGVNKLSGKNVTGITGGVITGYEAADIADAIREDEKNGVFNRYGEPLIPIYDGQTNTPIGYERSLSPEMRNVLQRNTHLGEMLGAWAGRQEEESLAQIWNEALVEKLRESWEAAKKTGRTAEYVDIRSPGKHDSSFAGIWEMVPLELREYMHEAFEDAPGIMVRRDMADNAFGYRMPSVKDLWSSDGKENDTKVAKAVRDISMSLFGPNVMPVLLKAEKGWMAGISVAKNTIVVRSIIVPVSNIASNVLQLLGRGVSLRDIVKGFGPKLVEIDRYLKNKEREVEIRALMARYREDRLRTVKLQAELKSIDDANKRMSIWPLIEAGEFSTISNGQTEADAALVEGTWAEKIQEYAEKVPHKLGVIGRYGMMTKDTALFQAMARAVNYGDFIAKAVYFDHLTKNAGIEKSAAMVKIGKEFVNYNLLPGPVRSYAESMGLTWFWAYKLRSIMVALNQMQENPLRSLLTGFGGSIAPGVPGVSVGSPITDNALTVIVEGRAPYSIGLDMLWSSFGLNPIVNIAS